MKYIVFVLSLFVSGIVYADGRHGPGRGHGHEHPHDHDGLAGPVGPQGPEGPRGLPGIQGEQGIQGFPGNDGGNDTHLIAGFGIIPYDGKHVMIEFFDDYDLRDSHNHELGFRVNLKLGKSYLEKEIESLKKSIESYRREIHKLSHQSRRDLEIEHVDESVTTLEQHNH